jgi:hypothetical protein
VTSKTGHELKKAENHITSKHLPEFTSSSEPPAGASGFRNKDATADGRDSADSTRPSGPGNGHVPPAPSSQIPGSDSKIAADLLVVEHMRLLGRLAHLFDRDRIEIGEKSFARLAHGRIDHPFEQH